MAEGTLDREHIHYIERRQHPTKADSWLIVLQAPAIAVTFAMTKSEFEKWVKAPPR